MCHRVDQPMPLLHKSHQSQVKHYCCKWVFTVTDHTTDLSYKTVKNNLEVNKTPPWMNVECTSKSNNFYFPLPILFNFVFCFQVKRYQPTPFATATGYCGNGASSKCTTRTKRAACASRPSTTSTRRSSASPTTSTSSTSTPKYCGTSEVKWQVNCDVTVTVIPVIRTSRARR